MTQKLKKLVFKTPNQYNSKALEVKASIKKQDPFLYVENFCRLKGPDKVYIIHKPLKMAAKFKTPDKILLDFRNSASYIALCLAHEYAHLVLRANVSLDYPVEQSLAILLQLSYEDFAGISKFDQVRAKELMQLMNCWPTGKPLLKSWLSC
jgi:hypothetical protein